MIKKILALVLMGTIGIGGLNITSTCYANAKDNVSYYSGGKYLGSSWFDFLTEDTYDSVGKYWLYNEGLFLMSTGSLAATYVDYYNKSSCECFGLNCKGEEGTALEGYYYSNPADYEDTDESVIAENNDYTELLVGNEQVALQEADSTVIKGAGTFTDYEEYSDGLTVTLPTCYQNIEISGNVRYLFDITDSSDKSEFTCHFTDGAIFIHTNIEGAIEGNPEIDDDFIDTIQDSLNSTRFSASMDSVSRFLSNYGMSGTDYGLAFSSIDEYNEYVSSHTFNIPSGTYRFYNDNGADFYYYTTENPTSINIDEIYEKYASGDYPILIGTGEVDEYEEKNVSEFFATYVGTFNNTEFKVVDNSTNTELETCQGVQVDPSELYGGGNQLVAHVTANTDNLVDGKSSIHAGISGEDTLIYDEDENAFISSSDGISYSIDDLTTEGVYCTMCTDEVYLQYTSTTKLEFEYGIIGLNDNGDVAFVTKSGEDITDWLDDYGCLCDYVTPHSTKTVSSTVKGLSVTNKTNGNVALSWKKAAIEAKLELAMKDSNLDYVNRYLTSYKYADKYKIEASLDNGASWKTVGTTSKNSYTFNPHDKIGAKYKTDIKFRVTPIYNSSFEKFNQTITINANPSKIATLYLYNYCVSAPSKITISDNGKISWSETDADKYCVYYNLNGTKKEITTKKTSLKVSSLKAGSYLVASVIAIKNGFESSEVSSKVVVKKPKKATIKKIKVDKRSDFATVKVTPKNVLCTKYEIRYATNKKMKNATKKSGLKINGLSRHKTYYIQVRAVTKYGGTTKYGKWSTIKKVTT
ncbi:fibronectin type III domain-containing protein [Eubacterium oxidoreducens]|uniref:Fibronectin type-III domain-containing protein n=1 Tax=Eubacterium oxidoreducens TaxID=1732 RepID=A0A1G6B1P7_EUBOX|nr:fibronectin type III domain-containing protein [Eubacterium oxidoreducens]SDB14566.1 hypothetical protein SAMN02910417_01058 [Eubacterium oxidoreducens]